VILIQKPGTTILLKVYHFDQRYSRKTGLLLPTPDLSFLVDFEFQGYISQVQTAIPEWA
jgi:hypothetical protein